MRCLLALAVFGFLLGVQLGAPVSAEETELPRKQSPTTPL